MSFRDDGRGQSVVVGSLLVFTILVLSFSAYQAFVVPGENADIEVEHFQETEDSFSEFRSNIVNAVGSDESRSTSLRLGTRYPTRAIALNPPPAAGRLETTEAGNVSFATGQNVCRDGGTPTTRSLVYTPGYNEYGEPRAIGYESRLVSKEFRGGSVYDQRLVRSASGDDQISLYLLTGEISENGVESYTLEVNGSNRYSTTITDPTITVPSRFNATQWEEDTLADRSNVTATDVGDRVELNFTGTHDVSCAVVGLNSDPAFTPPDDGGGGPGGSGGAYDVRWLDPSNESGTSSCSADDCTLDASKSRTLDLTAETVPTAQDATVDFSVNDSDVATIITPPLGNSDTGSDGRVSATVQAQSDGKVKVYTAGGGSGDVINVTVTNCPPSCI